MAGLEHGRGDLAPQVAPGRLAVQHHAPARPSPTSTCASRSPSHWRKLGAQSKPGQAVEQHVGRPDGVGHGFPSEPVEQRLQHLRVARGGDVDGARRARPGDHVEHLQSIQNVLERERLALRGVAARDPEGPAAVVARRSRAAPARRRSRAPGGRRRARRRAPRAAAGRPARLQRRVGGVRRAASRRSPCGAPSSSTRRAESSAVCSAASRASRGRVRAREPHDLASPRRASRSSWRSRRRRRRAARRRPAWRSGVESK